MSMPTKMRTHIKIAVMVTVAVSVYWVAGCAKKSEREAVPETRDTLPEIPTTLTDIRDGKTYKTVKIGEQIWMAENLNYRTDRSWCYDNYSPYCDVYGRLYDWKTAMAEASSSFANPSGVQGVCPSGWHLPSRAEWDILENYVGSSAGRKLKSVDFWIWNYHSSHYGTDEYGFSALPGGFFYDPGDNNSFGVINYYGSWWAATAYSDGKAYYRSMHYDTDSLYEDGSNKSTGFSVRCVDDTSATSALSQKSVGDDRAKIEMVFVKGGTFKMGCTSALWSDCFDNEKPAHSVTVGDFYIGKYEVTQNQWVRVMGNSNNNSHFEGGNLPVENVSWNNVQKFILRLNTMTGKKYRLPTEAEWEYAARGGARSKGYKYSGSNNVNYAAWYSMNSGDKVLRDGLLEKYAKKNDFAGYEKILSSNKNSTRSVGTKAPNELGIYDMSGNVWEWVNDWYGNYSSAAQTNPIGPTSGSYSVPLRGGSWDYGARYCRVSNRYNTSPDSRDGNVGFRLVLSPP